MDSKDHIEKIFENAKTWNRAKPQSRVLDKILNEVSTQPSKSSIWWVAAAVVILVLLNGITLNKYVKMNTKKVTSQKSESPYTNVISNFEIY